MLRTLILMSSVVSVALAVALANFPQRAAESESGPSDKKLKVVVFGGHPDDRGTECGVEFAEAYRLVEPKQGCPLLPVGFLASKGDRPLPETGQIDQPAAVSDAVRDRDGILVHTVRSEFQAGETMIRVLVPDGMGAGVRLPVVYVLPVEARDERRFGDGLLEVRRLGLHNKFRAIFVAPTFSHLPWYADHPTDSKIHQESYFLKIVVPSVEARYPARSGPDGRFLLGFSKSGWGAFSLLLRHPDVFAKAAAWDAPLMMDRPGKYGSGDIFGTAENFENYRITGLLKHRAAELGENIRLIHLGYGNFRDEHEAFEAILNQVRIPHRYVDGPKREHRWESGWVPEAVEILLGGDEKFR